MNQFQYDEVPPVKVQSGMLQGYKVNQVFLFKGVPYAQAKRFQMPENPNPWEGIKDATAYGFVCPLLNKETPTGELLVPHRYWPMDENCLNLNIWTKALDTKAKKPVMVWLHGGGYFAGSSIEQQAYDGYQMCDKGDAVVISVNHRLNILGFLDLSPFGEKYKNSANAGLADLVAALKWIQKNIASFGGDPENVTIFGQSGGGMKATGLMQIPQANGLFHKAIVMSGVTDGKLLQVLPGDGREIVKAILDKLKLTEAEVEKLETIPYEELAKAYKEVSMSIACQGKYYGGVPMANDYYLGEPLLTKMTDHAKTIPLMIGTVFGEFSFKPLPFSKKTATMEEVKEWLVKQFGDNTEEIIHLFEEAYPGKHLGDVLNLDRIFRGSSKILAKMHSAESKAPTYLYNFVLEFPYQNGKIAWHCADIPFVFHNTHLVDICSIPGVTEVLEHKIFEAVMQFARTGNPNHQMLPEWAAVTPEEESTMIFDQTCEVRINYDDVLLELIEKILPPFSLAFLAEQDVQH